MDEHMKGIEELRRRYPWPDEKPEVPEIRIPGWRNQASCQQLFEVMQFRASKAKLIVELGSWLGQSTRAIADAAPLAVVAAIDHWKGSEEHHRKEKWRVELPQLYEKFLACSWEYRHQIIPMRANTVEGMQEIADLDLKPELVYVDADHAEPAVMCDLRTAHELFPAAKLLGDDWVWHGVRRAVTYFAAQADARLALPMANTWELTWEREREST